MRTKEPPAPAPPLGERRQQPARSTLALCSVALAHAYLLLSVFPYGGFMAMELIPEASAENAGSYAGLLASAFMLGRSLSSVGWGKVADRRGRRFVMRLSLLLSAGFSLLFGCARSFPLALLWRFLLGLSNATIMIAKVVASELASGDRRREQSAVSAVMSMWGAAFLFAPALAGLVAEPARQYPGAAWLQGGGAPGRFLRTYPFFGPNAVGAALCVASLVLCHLYVPETLPGRRRRSRRRPPPAVPEETAETTPILSSDEPTTPAYGTGRNGKAPPLTPALSSDDSYGTGRNGVAPSDDESDYEDEDAIVLPPEILRFVLDDVEDAVRASHIFGDAASSPLNTARARSSIASGVSRRSSAAAERRRSRRSLAPAAAPAPAAPPDDSSAAESTDAALRRSVADLWSSAQVRRHLVVYWIASFIAVAQDEAFPLFCLSLDAGLGLSENGIGRILSASGVLDLALQFVVYAPLVARTGLYGSMRWATVALPPLAAAVPLSLLINQSAALPQQRGTISWCSFAFLVTDLALARALGMTFMSGITVATNRLVPPSQRATLNGLGVLGGSLCKSLGPVLAGLLVAFSFSSGVFSPHGGAAFLFLVIGGANVVTTVAAFCFLHEEDED